MARKQERDYDERSSDDDEIGEEEAGPPTINPYEVLGLEHEATADDVKKAYRKMALKHHPGTGYPLHALYYAHIDQTRPPMVRKRTQIRSSRKSHSHTPSYLTTADASDMISRAVRPNRSKTTKTLTG